MNKNEHPAQSVQRFNQSLDSLARDHEAVDMGFERAEQEMLMVAQALLTHDFTALSDAKSSIHKSIKEIKPSTRTWLSFSKAATLSTLIVLATFAIACAVSPELRTRTREVLVQIGDLLFTSGPTDAQRSLPYLEDPTLSHPVEATPWSPITQEEASLRAGFTVLVPGEVAEQEWEQTYRPEWGTPKKVTWQIFEAPTGGVVIECDCFRFQPVTIHEQKVSEQELREFAVSDAEITEVQVRGTRGYWIEHAPTGLSGSGASALSFTEGDIVWQITDENFLFWLENGVLYGIEGSGELSLNDFLAVAESLSP